MTPNLEILISEKDIQERIFSLAEELMAEYQGKSLVVVGVLKGSFVFMGDLIRNIKEVPLTCEFLRVSSYKNDKSTGQIRVDFDVTQSIEGKDVLLVEDIVDTGNTLKFLIEHLKAKNPASLKVCSMLYKEINPEIKQYIDYCGFEIADKYVVGYGMDSEGLYRSLPYIAYFTIEEN